MKSSAKDSIKESALNNNDIFFVNQEAQVFADIQAIERERIMYQDLANTLPVGIYRLRVFHDTGISEEKWHCMDEPPYKVEFINRRFFEILDIDQSAYIRNPGIINSYIHEDDKADFVSKNVEANFHTIPFKWEGRFIKNEQIKWIHFESNPRIQENKDILWTGFVEDISDRKRAEEELQLKNKELQVLNGEKDKFLSIMSHDLISPFNSILGYSRLLMDNFHQKDIETVSEYCMIIRNSSQRAMNLLQNLMLWSQSQIGHNNFNPELFDLGKLIDENIQLYESIAAQKNIRIRKITTDPLIINADKRMIGTVIRNLVSNAIKFTPTRGRIQVKANVISDKLTLVIRDNGIGIPEEVIDKIFLINYRQTLPDTDGEKGTGLGLLLCKEFIDKHKGTITVKSKKGKGSVFRVEIPQEQ